FAARYSRPWPFVFAAAFSSPESLFLPPLGDHKLEYSNANIETRRPKGVADFLVRRLAGE
ncbi:hypothetical protein, partial [Mesorhizobium sp. M8A.F.Ca.ET.198.01.1.1]|uniref:hypothetical protein n=1 Tax=Mesorhizobium sp. M8A.F.Ca.ET.198.01.1.1 TaxID=2563966 RepID=UPI001AEE33BD